MEKALFDDLIAACNEAIKYEKGTLRLNSHTVTISDEDIELSQLLYRKIEKLPEIKRQKVMRYIDELTAI